MQDFTIRTPQQLPAVLRGFRKAAGLTQGDVAERLGVRQQTLSALERRADTVSAGRMMKLLAILGVELVLRQREPELVLREPGVADGPLQRAVAGELKSRGPVRRGKTRAPEW